MIYPYMCEECKHEWEAEQSVKDEKIKVCPKCGAEKAKRLIGKTNFVLLGSSWARDNYK